MVPSDNLGSPLAVLLESSVPPAPDNQIRAPPTTGVPTFLPSYVDILRGADQTGAAAPVDDTTILGHRAEESTKHIQSVAQPSAPATNGNHLPPPIPELIDYGSIHPIEDILDSMSAMPPLWEAAVTTSDEYPFTASTQAAFSPFNYSVTTSYNLDSPRQQYGSPSAAAPHLSMTNESPTGPAMGTKTLSPEQAFHLLSNSCGRTPSTLDRRTAADPRSISGRSISEPGTRRQPQTPRRNIMASGGPRVKPPPTRFGEHRAKMVAKHRRGTDSDVAELTGEETLDNVEDKRHARMAPAPGNQQGRLEYTKSLQDLETTKGAWNGLFSKKRISASLAIKPVALAVDNPSGVEVCSILEIPKSIIISRKMLASEIILHLVNSGCADVTNKLDLSQCGTYPIAGGGFGDIYCGALACGTRVAIKCPRLFLKNDEQGNKILKACNVAREIYAWSKLKHPNVLDLVGLSTFRGQISIVSAWMENGTLPEYIAANPGVNRYQLCIQISTGLAHLHESDTVHGDMKGLNVLISDKGVAKLTDFGNAVLKKHTLEFTGTTSGSKISVRWTAPEVLKGESAYTKEADVYALGMTFLETITGKIPFSDKVEHAVYGTVMAGKTPERPKELDAMEKDKVEVLWRAMSWCWNYEAANRPRAFEVEYSLEGIEQNQARIQSRGDPFVSSAGTEYFTPG
ncbi:hypothetical protein FRC06_000451 [Ceratobasidium sp. 370]|nr:hypothetical protein FRC06_000451 [Ceratobasidium sp. 370]